MIAPTRPTAGPLPGDLFLDPAVPDGERVTISRGGWSAQASHVWTGTGWSRLVGGVVHDVPAHPEVTLPRQRDVVEAPAAAVAPSAAGLETYRRRRSARESVAELLRKASVADAG